MSDSFPPRADDDGLPPPAVDLFDGAGRPEGALHPGFRQLRDSPLLAPARELLRALQGDFPDREFAERFRSGSFEAALLEIYLFEMFRSGGHQVDRSHRDPAFLLARGGIRAAVDALTVGIQPGDGSGPASGSPRDEQPRAGAGGSLIRKLQQRQWALPHTDGLPFVIAVQDFEHMELPHGAPTSAVLHFLFGAPPSHEIGAVLPEGFFGLGDAEHISGVLFCCDATVSKFNRLAQEGHGSQAVHLLRHGSCLGAQGDPAAPAGFVYEVGHRGTQREAWNEGTVLVHNPHARHPLPRKWLGAATEVAFEDGHVATRFERGFHPFTCTTETLAGDTPAWWLEMRTRLLEREMAAHPPA